MRDFRSHLRAFGSQGKGCSSPPTRTSGMDISSMMKAKFKKSWRHSLIAWITLMFLLLLVFVYAENTKWDDSWFRTPTKYNISALLEEGMDDDAVIGSSGKPSAAKVVDDGDAGKEDKAGKKISKESKQAKAAAAGDTGDEKVAQ